MRNNNLLTTDKHHNVEINGEGTKGRPIRVYLMNSEEPYSISVFDNETGEKILNYDNCETNRILYYRLKSTQKLIIKNKVGKLKLL